MSNDYILFYDSGVGGLTTLSETIKLLPDEKYLYFADDCNCPYGNKEPEEIQAIVVYNLKKLLKTYPIKMVVFACNTITTCCVEYLRELYDILFVGTEPAIKPALEYSKTGEVLTIATKATFRQKKYERLLLKSNGKVYSFGLVKLADRIERNIVYGEEFCFGLYLSQIKRVLKAYNKIDGLVLGCTHYCYCKEEFARGLNINVYDGNNGVARRVKHLLVKKNKINIGGGGVEIKLSSGNQDKVKRYEKTLKNLLYYK